MKDIKKIYFINKVLAKKITGREAARELGYSEVHISRLKKRYREEGIEGFIRKRRISGKKVPKNIRSKIINIYIRKYMDFNILHFNEKLKEMGIVYSYETIRKILIEQGIHKFKPRKKVYRRRMRMPKQGMLIQMDSSLHNWIPAIKKKWWLICAVDDATSKILYMKFYKSDCVFSNMEVIKKIIQKHGLFSSLYTDKASHFKSTRLGGLHYNTKLEQDDTQIQRALNQLGINIIHANSPQAKGKIERTFRTLQDRLINEMKIAHIYTYNKANQFIENYFIDYYNSKFAKNIDAETVFIPVDNNINLELIFSKKYTRKVHKDNTVSFFNHNIQLLPTKNKLSFARSNVDLYLFQDNTVYILFKNKIILITSLNNNKLLNYKRKSEKLLNEKIYSYV